MIEMSFLVARALNSRESLAGTFVGIEHSVGIDVNVLAAVDWDVSYRDSPRESCRF